MKYKTIILTLTFVAASMLTSKVYSQSSNESLEAKNQAKMQERKDATRMADAKTNKKEARAKAKDAKRIGKDADDAAKESKSELKMERKAQKSRKKANEQSKKALKARDKSDGNDLP
jgi:hypothetical protein